MAFPIVFILFIIAVYLFQHHLRKNTKIEDEAKKQFWRKEEKSLIVRKKEIDPSEYIHIPVGELDLSAPAEFQPGDKLLFKQLIEQISNLSDKDMMNFSYMSNTDIRLEFGTANQSIIGANEEHYNNYLKALFSLSKLYIRYNRNEQAIALLERCLEMKSDYTQHFLTLGELYSKEGQSLELASLISKAESLDSPTKKGLLNNLESLQ